MLRGKKILLGITGSIAAYKSALIARLLVKDGADVIVIMTPSSKDFITPVTLSTLSNNPVLSESFFPITGKWNSHVEFGNWADIMLIAPISANTIAKMANGIADNMLLTTYLSARCPVYFAPAMDLEMYNHPATQKNIQTLLGYGNILIKPVDGELASGLHGFGRMEEPERIVYLIKEFFMPKDFRGKTVLVTAGPTYESIDSVRYIGNYSSGLMGFSIAEEFAQRGAEVILVSGPTQQKAVHSNIERYDVVSANEMYDSCMKYFERADIAVMTAAVADYTFSNPEKNKIKKDKNDLNITFNSTKDILLELGKMKRSNQQLIGFALETENEIENAQNKLRNKNLDLIILNLHNENNPAFSSALNQIKIIDKKFNITDYPVKTKIELAKDIVSKIKEII